MRLKALLLLLLSTAALYPQAPAVEIRGSIGSTSFLDDGSQNHLLLAPSVRYYFHPHFAVEGEFQYLRQSRQHHDLVLLPSFVWDIRPGKHVVPYLSAGVGWARGTFDRFNTTDSFLQGGAGAKIFLSDHWYVAPELKVGFDAHARLSGLVGYIWRR